MTLEAVGLGAQRGDGAERLGREVPDETDRSLIESDAAAAPAIAPGGKSSSSSCGPSPINHQLHADQREIEGQVLTLCGH